MKVKHVVMCVALFLLCNLAVSSSGFPEELTPYQIMKKSNDLLNQADDSKAEMVMTLINKSGDQRVRKILAYGKNYGNDVTKSLIIFQYPADVKGTSFLVWGESGKKGEDQQWLYLPAMQRVRPVSTAGRGESFLGTEFSYYDMGSRSLDDDLYSLLKEEKVGTEKCYVIEAKPKVMKYYSKVIFWIRKDNYIPLKMDFYDKKGGYLKQATMSKIENIQGINTPRRIEMANAQTGNKTVIEFNNIKYNTGLSDSIFTERYMTRGK